MNRRPARTGALLLALASCAAAAVRPERVEVAVHDAPLLTVVEALARQCQAGLVADAGCAEALAGRVTVVLAQASWEEAVMVLLRDHHLALQLDHGQLMVARAVGNQRRDLAMVFYDLRLLEQPLPDTHGHGLAPPAPAGSHIGPPIEPVSKPELSEFIELIQQCVAPESWKTDGVAIQEYHGALVVTQTPEIQALVAQALTQLERRRAAQLVCRFYRLPKPPPGDGATLSSEQWAAVSGDAVLSEMAIIHSGQRRHLFSGNERMYVADLDVVQGIQQPVVSALGSGIDLEVTPTISIGGVLVRLAMEVTVDAQWAANVISDDRGQQIGTIATPRMATDAVNDARLIPPGGAAIYRVGARAYALTAEVMGFGAEDRFGPSVPPIHRRRRRSPRRRRGPARRGRPRRRPRPISDHETALAPAQAPR